jgi:hypothetical protein
MYEFVIFVESTFGYKDMKMWIKAYRGCPIIQNLEKKEID